MLINGKTSDTPIFLNSIDGVKPISKPHDFVINFEEGIVLDSSKSYYLALDSINMSYSWYNVKGSYDNEKLKYSHDKGTTWTQIVLDDGNYTYSDIQDALRTIIRENGHSKNDDANPDVSISFITTSLKCMILLGDDFQLDLKGSNFAELVGFEKRIVDSFSIGELTPNIMMSVDSILIRCDLLSSSIFSGKHTDILFTFPLIDKALSFPFETRPRRLLFSRVNTNFVKRMRIYITDGLDRPIDLNGVEISLTLLLREESNYDVY